MPIDIGGFQITSGMEDNLIPSIVTNGLVLHLDAGNTSSYPGSGTTWYDISGQNAHAVAVNMPTFVSNGVSSYFSFDGTDDELHSVNISQQYIDICILHYLTNAQPILPMLFGHYDNQDDSLRFENGVFRTSPDFNDWHYQQNSSVFVNGTYNAVGVDLRNRWTFIRSYRSNTDGFGTSFRYEISSSFMNRRYSGSVSVILCYGRQLSNTEVEQNYNALKGRYGL